MAKLRVRCPQGHLLEVELAHAGKQVQCPMCQTIMRIPDLPRARPVAAASSPAPLPQKSQESEDAGEEEFEKKPKAKKSGTKAGLAKVRVGVTYQIAQLYVKVIGSILLTILVAVMAFNNAAAVIKAQGQVDQVPDFGMVAFFGSILSLTSLILGILCCVYILGLPERTRAKWLAIAYVGLEVAGFVCGMIVYLVPGLGLVLGLLQSFLGIASQVCFILLLKRLCEFLKRWGLAAQATSLLAMLGAIAMGYLILFLSRFVPVLAILGLVGGLILLVMGLWFLIRYLKLLHAVRDAL